MPDWTEPARTIAARGATDEEIVRGLQDAGASPTDAIRALRRVRDQPRVPGLDPSGMQRAAEKYSFIDARGGDPRRALTELVRACEEADTAELVWLAVLVVEPLLDAHAGEIEEDFAQALRASHALRVAYRGSYLHIPSQLRQRFDDIVAGERSPNT